MLKSILIAALLFIVLVSAGPHLVNAILIVLYLYGVWKSFQTHWAFGLVSAVFVPIGFVIGIGSLIWRRNIAKALLGK